MIKNYIDSILKTLKHTFSFAGRAARMEFWSYVITSYLIIFLLSLIGAGLSAIAGVLGAIWMGLTAIIAIALFIPSISLTVRRLHDVNLSGFWLWYMNSFGLPVVYMVYLLDLDHSVNNIIEKIKNIGSIWLGWIITILCWTVGAPITLFLLFLYKGTAGENNYGPDPLAEATADAAPLAEATASAQ